MNQIKNSSFVISNFSNLMIWNSKTQCIYVLKVFLCLCSFSSYMVFMLLFLHFGLGFLHCYNRIHFESLKKSLVCSMLSLYFISLTIGFGFVFYTQRFNFVFCMKFFVLCVNAQEFLLQFEGVAIGGGWWKQCFLVCFYCEISFRVECKTRHGYPGA